MKKQKKRSKKLVIILAAAAVLLVAIAVWFLVYSASQDNQPSTSANNSDDYGKVDYSPATDADKAYNDQIKEDLGNPEQPSSTSTATVTIVDAAQYGPSVEARAIINDVIENGGTCTFTFTGPGKTVEKITEAVADASATRCTNLTIPASSFDTKGAWKLVVTYKSSKSSGTSPQTAVEIK